jgi:hypothetical protein
MDTTVNIVSIANADEKHEEIIRAGGRILQAVLKREEFGKEVLAADFSGGRFFRARDGKVTRKDNSDILKIIQMGQERSTTGDGILTMKIELRPHRRGVVGSAKLGNQPIMPAYWFVEQCAARSDGISMARHLIHEWMHVAGFFHQSSGPGQDDVPYEIGNIVRKLAKQLAINKELDDDLTGFTTEDSLAAHWLDAAEDEVDFDAT